jgi:hypothetical protein
VLESRGSSGPFGQGDPERSRLTRATAVPALGVLLYASLVGVGLWVAGVPLTHEDGFYYFSIARNLAAGNGSTFDGLHPTNGYHPLWLLVLAALHRLAPAGRALVWGTILQAALLAAAASIVFLAVRRAAATGPAVLAALVFVGLTERMALSGLELMLHATLVAACAWAWLAVGTGTAGRAFAVGGLLALGVLARLDVMLLAVALAAWVGPGPGRRARVLALVGPPALALAACVLWNQVAFGHPLPVSAAAKRLWSHALVLRDPAYAAGGWAWAKVMNALFVARHLGSTWVFGLALGTVGALVVSFTPVGRATRALRPFAAAGTAQLGAYVLLHHGELTYARWYYVLPPLMAAVTAADVVAWAAGRAGRLRTAIPALACMLVALGTAVGLARWGREESPRLPLIEAAFWARTELPPDARIGSWNAGALGYLSGRTVVNLDGLVNSWTFLESEQYDLCAYWERNGITHVIDAFSEDGPGGTPVVVPVVLPAAQAYARCAGRLRRVWEGGPEGRPWRVRAYALARSP